MIRYKYRIAKIRKLTDEKEFFVYVVQKRFLVFFWVAVSPLFDHRDNARHFFYKNFKK
jgi:hypothetical protein